MIPRHLHFIFGMTPHDKTWSLVHYVCVKSAIENIRPDKVSFYSQYEPSGPWWALTKPLVDLVPVTAPDAVFGRPITHPAHKADIIRLERLLRHGGIYLDVDVLVHASFDSLLHHSTVLGREGEGAEFQGLCNAVILAEPEAPFLRRWYEEYRDFDGSKWNEHSVLRPAALAAAHPEEIEVLDHKAFFWPIWDYPQIYSLFASRRDLRSRFANHLWENQAWTFLDDLDVGHVRRVDSVFHRWARPYLEGLPDDYGGGTATIHGVRRDIYARARHVAKWRFADAKRMTRGIRKMLLPNRA